MSCSDLFPPSHALVFSYVTGLARFPPIITYRSSSSRAIFVGLVADFYKMLIPCWHNEYRA